MSEAAVRPPTPLVAWALPATIVLAYVAYAFAPRDAQVAVEYALALIPERFHAEGEYPFAAWYEAGGPILGHAFLHMGWLHVGLNAFFLLAAGRLPAMRLGPLRFLAVFFVSVAGGGLLFVALNWSGQDVAVGASGGVCGMFSAHFLAMRASWREALADPRVRNPLGMLIFLNVVLMGVAAEAGVIPIAWEGHLGGFMGGALAYILLAPKPRGPWG